MNYDLVDMIDNQYTLPTLGNDAYDSLRMIDKMKEKFVGYERQQYTK